MDNERKITFDDGLQVEAYLFKGIMQKFPTHFHEHYVIGCVESGRRSLTCGNEKYIISPGDMVVFNPYDNHSCAQIDANPLVWRCLNIKEKIMAATTEKFLGTAVLPRFTSTVLYHSELTDPFKNLHEFILNGEKNLHKATLFTCLIEKLTAGYSVPAADYFAPVRDEIHMARNFMERHFSENISLDKLSALTGLNKYTLLRYFVRWQGITPYQYLETIRVNEAKNLIENGESLIEAALSTGFSDQSHFSRFFKNFIGLTPRQYQKAIKNETQQKG